MNERCIPFNLEIDRCIPFRDRYLVWEGLGERRMMGR
jgi:hypothetical protein